jgi:hypothetical protein
VDTGVFSSSCRTTFCIGIIHEHSLFQYGILTLEITLYTVMGVKQHEAWEV